MTPAEIVEDAVHTIIRGWDENEAEAGQLAQQEQNPDAWDHYMQAQVGAVVQGAVDQCTAELRGELRKMADAWRKEASDSLDMAKTYRGSDDRALAYDRCSEAIELLLLRTNTLLPNNQEATSNALS